MNIHRKNSSSVMILIWVTRTQATCTRNLNRIERSSIRCKFLVPETFKHSRPIKPHNFGHVHRCKLLVKVSCTSFLSVYHRIEQIKGNSIVNTNYIGLYSWSRSLDNRRHLIIHRSIRLTGYIGPLTLTLVRSSVSAIIRTVAER